MNAAMPPHITTRKPTGKPSWPILLLAGAEKTGKSYSAAVATSSPLVGRCYWVTIGEDEPDEYGQLGDFDIVQHDGTYQGILAAIRDVDAQLIDDRGTPLLVVDSMTRLWDLITSHAQDVANQRARRKGKASQDQDAQITMDLWNAAKDQWQNVMDAIRAFPGPVILTARLDVVAVMNDAGQPTPQKTTKVQAHKSLPYDVGAVIEMPARGDTWITGVRSVRLKLGERTKAPKDFSVDWFWRQLGLHELETSARDHKMGTPGVKSERGHADETRVVSASDGDVTPAPAQESTPSRIVDLSGAGRDKPPAKNTKTRSATSWVSQLMECDTLEALTELRQMALEADALNLRTRDGHTVDEWFYKRREGLLQEAAAEPDPEPVEPQYVDDELPF